MYRPTFQSNLWLGIITIAFLALYYWSETSVVADRPEDYNQKVLAAQTMEKALETLKQHRLPGETITNEDTGDPITYTMLGEKNSPITTDEGSIQDKITVLNPNFAAVIVDLLNEAQLEKGDTVAVMVTGSMPGANIATYAAISALELTPVIITSVGSSWWGANSPDFTWLDMEAVLFNNRVFNFKSLAASAGGSDDQGGLRLSDLGQSLISDAVNRNELTYIHQGSLRENIQGRLELLKRQTALSSYKAVINVGGGIAALGHHLNSRLISTGVHQRYVPKNYPNLGVIHYLGREGAKIVQIYNVTKLAKQYDLPVGQLPVPKAGVGRVFKEEKYNLVTAAIALGLMFAILVVVKLYDRKRFQWREENPDPDNIV